MFLKREYKKYNNEGVDFLHWFFHDKGFNIIGKIMLFPFAIFMGFSMIIMHFFFCRKDD